MMMRMHDLDVNYTDYYSYFDIDSDIDVDVDVDDKYKSVLQFILSYF